MKDILARSNLRQHKITSKRGEIMTTFQSQDLANNLKGLDLSGNKLPKQYSLSLEWDLKKDVFTFKVPTMKKPLTHRGILFTLNSLYHHLDFAAPVTIQGKFILRELMNKNSKWDCSLPQEMHELWSSWRYSLKEPRDIQILSVFTTIRVHKEFHVFF